jgi:dihydroorotate dehydrogenase
MVYRTLLRPLLFRLPTEAAHELGLRFISSALHPSFIRKLTAGRLSRSPFGPLERFGLSFENPVGLAAGFDKNGVAASSLSALGFGFIEVGTVTTVPQPGNPKPRLFRLPQDRALINRAGFNNDGAAVVCARLSEDRPSCVLGVNIGKSRVVSIEDAVADYLSSFEHAHRVADYIAVNVSSPNTPNLRELQKPEALASLLKSLQLRNSELSRVSPERPPVPLLVKIAPDVNHRDLESIVETVISAGVDGIIATNTTIARNGLRTESAQIESIGAGGLSGAPLAQLSTAVIASLYLLTRGRIPIIGVGGIFSAKDAWEKICAGASLVQLYTGFIYEGPSVVKNINEGLFELLSSSGFKSLDAAVGCRAQEFAGVV